MQPLSQSENRTIRLGAIIVGACLLFVAGRQLWKVIGGQSAEYHRLLAETDTLREELKPYKGKVEDIRTLMEKFKVDPNHLSRTSVVAEASAAILKTATSSGVQLGPIHEAAARQANKEISSIQLDCTGQVSAVLGFLYRFESIGYPIIVESVQLNSDPSKPGNLKMHLALVILDFDQWKPDERTPNA